MGQNRSPLTTLCYIERGDEYLMMHRVKKKNDVNQDKWIGVGGHFEEGESPEECLLREIKEETGLSVTEFQFRGLVTFASDGWPVEYMCLYTASYPEDAPLDPAELPCPEGELVWVKKAQVPVMGDLWEGDKIFLQLLEENRPFFSLKLSYQNGDVLKEAVLDGKKLELFDIVDEQGLPSGRVTARMTAHRYGILHRTAHIWIIRKREDGGFDVLVQKRALTKDSFPGTYDISSAGHIEAGAEPDESAKRELFEELGILAEEGDLKYQGTFYSGDIIDEFHGIPFWDREIAHVYIYDKEVHADQLTLQESEVDSVCWIDSEALTRKIAEQPELYCINMPGYQKVLDYIEEIRGKVA